MLYPTYLQLINLNMNLFKCLTLFFRFRLNIYQCCNALLIILSLPAECFVLLLSKKIFFLYIIVVDYGKTTLGGALGLFSQLLRSPFGPCSLFMSVCCLYVRASVHAEVKVLCIPSTCCPESDPGLLLLPHYILPQDIFIINFVHLLISLWTVRGYVSQLQSIAW